MAGNTPRDRHGQQSPDADRTPAANDLETAAISGEELEAIERHERDVAQRQAPPSSRLERGTGLVLIAATTIALIASRNIDVRVATPGVGPRWWPTLLSSIALVLSILLSVIAFIRPPLEREGVESTTPAGWRRFGITIVIIALFLIAWTETGNFIVPCVLMLAALLFSYGSRSWKPLIFFPVLTTALVYLLFHSLLQIPL